MFAGGRGFTQCDAGLSIQFGSLTINCGNLFQSFRFGFFGLFVSFRDRLRDHLHGLSTHTFLFQIDLLFGFSQSRFGACRQQFLLASQFEFICDKLFLNRFANFLRNVNVPHKAVQQRQLLFFQYFVKRSGNFLLKLLTSFPDQQIHSSYGRTFVATDAFDLWDDNFRFNSLKVTERRNHIRGLIRHDSPDSSEVHVDLEPVI